MLTQSVEIVEIVLRLDFLSDISQLINAADWMYQVSIGDTPLASSGRHFWNQKQIGDDGLERHESPTILVKDTAAACSI